MHRIAKLFLVIFISLNSTNSFALCEQKKDVSLVTLQVAEGLASQKLRQLNITRDVAMKARTVEERKWDLERVKRLFRQGIVPIGDLEAVELQVDEATLDLEERKLDLQLLQGEIEITERQLELSCGIEPIPMEEISKFAKIYAERWEKKLTFLNPRIDITERKLKMSVTRYEWMKMMVRKGYRSKKELRDAGVEVFRYEKLLENQKGELEIRQSFIDKLKALA